MYAILGILPISLAIILMVFARQKASVSLLAAWALSLVLAVIFWNMNILHAGAYTISGFLQAINIIFIVLGAIFMLNALLELKFIETIGNGFNGISQDRRIQILIIAWLFGSFIEGAAGFGTPGAIAAPLLVGLGFPPFFAALPSLLQNGVPVIFGAAGTPTTAGFASIQPTIAAQFGAETAAAIFTQLNIRASFTQMFIGSFLPFIMVASVVARDGRKRGLKDAFNILPLCLYSGIIFTVPFWLISHLGPQLPTLGGTLIAMPLLLIAVKKGFLVPKEVYRFQNDPVQEIKGSKSTGVSLITAWSPYAIIVLALLIFRFPLLPFAAMLRNSSVTISIMGILGSQGINWSWQPLWNPGILPFLPVAIIFLIARKASGETIKKITAKTIKQLKHAAIALFFGVAMVQIMLNTSYSVPAGELTAMSSEIAKALASIFGGMYLFVSPVIGIFGAFVAGSATVSNMMFYGLQLEAAQSLGLPLLITLVAQTCGSAIGNMIAINNVIAITATTNYKEKETTLMAAALIPVIIFSLAVSITLFIFIGIGMNWAA